MGSCSNPYRYRLPNTLLYKNILVRTHLNINKYKLTLLILNCQKKKMFLLYTIIIIIISIILFFCPGQYFTCNGFNGLDFCILSWPIYNDIFYS